MIWISKVGISGKGKGEKEKDTIEGDINAI